MQSVVERDTWPRGLGGWLPRRTAQPDVSSLLLLVHRAERRRRRRRLRSLRRRIALLDRLAVDDDVERLVRDEARAGRDQAAHDDVLLEAAQGVRLAVDGGLG